MNLLTSLMRQMNAVVTAPVTSKPPRVCAAKERYLKHLSTTRWISSPQLKDLLFVASTSAVNRFLNGDTMSHLVEKKVQRFKSTSKTMWRLRK